MKCPTCGKEVYFAHHGQYRSVKIVMEKRPNGPVYRAIFAQRQSFTRAEKLSSNGRDYHKSCHRCDRCKKSLAAGAANEHQGKLYCTNPCYATLFGPGGFRAGTGTAGSAKYD